MPTLGTPGPAAASYPLPDPAGVVLPAAAHAYLNRSASSLRDAIVADDVPARYASAHVAALQAAAAYLSARTPPTPTARRRSRNAWVLLAEVAPGLAGWATHFAGGAATYQAAQAGSTRGVSAEAADALVVQADRFLAVVESELGLLPHERVAGRGVA